MPSGRGLSPRVQTAPAVPHARQRHRHRLAPGRLDPDLPQVVAAIDPPRPRDGAAGHRERFVAQRLVADADVLAEGHMEAEGALAVVRLRHPLELRRQFRAVSCRARDPQHRLVRQPPSVGRADRARRIAGTPRRERERHRLVRGRRDCDFPQIAAPIHAPGGLDRASRRRQGLVAQRLVADRDRLAEHEPDRERARAVMRLRCRLEAGRQSRELSTTRITQRCTRVPQVRVLSRPAPDGPSVQRETVLCHRPAGHAPVFPGQRVDEKQRLRLRAARVGRLSCPRAQHQADRRRSARDVHLT